MTKYRLRDYRTGVPFAEPTDQPPRWLSVALHPPTWLTDGALAAFLTLVVVGGGLVRTDATLLPTLGLGCATVALAWRQRWPLAVFAIACAAYVVDGTTAHNLGTGQPAIAVATYTVVQRIGRRAAVLIWVLASTVVVVAETAYGLPNSRAIPSVIFLAGAAILGVTLAERRRERVRERELLAAQAAAEERVRLARELHDIVAHHLSVIVLQAGVLSDTMGENSSAQAILDSGREAMAEMRRVLQVLRTTDTADPRAPQPGLGDLDALIERVNAAGVAVDVTTEGEPRELPAAVDLSAYRILQEALTNVLRHAQASRATVRVAYSPEAVELEVVDDGIGPPTDDVAGTGHGLEGMAERAALFGGEIRWGAASGRGYKLSAVLPL
jgi:signal transduction histidine kinase